MDKNVSLVPSYMSYPEPARNVVSLLVTAGPAAANIIKLQHAVTDVLNKYSPTLSKLVRGEVLKQFAREMLAAKLIMDDQITNSSYDDIIMTFKAAITFKKTRDKLSSYCSVFIAILKSLGRPLEDAAETTDDEWKEVLKQ